MTLVANKYIKIIKTKENPQLSMRGKMDLIYRRVWLKGLVISCPFDKALVDCPANEIRKLPLSERMAFVDNLTPQQIDETLAHHKNCLTERDSL